MPQLTFCLASVKGELGIHGWWMFSPIPQQNLVDSYIEFCKHELHNEVHQGVSSYDPSIMSWLVFA
jgi:hypothetical protein